MGMSMLYACLTSEAILRKREAGGRQIRHLYKVELGKGAYVSR